MSNTHTKPTEAEIEVCAYCIWEVEGRPEGRGLNHWLEAEKQLAASGLHEEAATEPKKDGPRKRAKKSSNP